MNIAFDTLQYADALEAAGVSVPQAKAQAKALASVLNESANNVLATKADVNKLEAQLVLTREHFDAKLRQMEQRMTVKMAVMLISVLAGVLIATAKLIST